MSIGNSSKHFSFCSPSKRRAKSSSCDVSIFFDAKTMRPLHGTRTCCYMETTGYRVADSVKAMLLCKLSLTF